MNPRRVWSDLRASFTLWRRYPMRILIGFATPAVFMLLLGSTFGALGTSTLHVVDEDQTPESLALLQTLEGLDSLDLVLVAEPPPAADASDWMKRERAVGLLWIPRGYGETLRGNATNASSNVVLYVDRDRGAAGPALQSAVDAALAQEALRARTGAEAIRTESRAVATGEIPYREFLVSGMIGLNVLSVSLFGMVGTTTAFRYSGLFKKLATTPFRKSEWLLSKLLFQPLVTLLGSIVLIGIALIAFQPRLAVSPLAVALIVAGSLAITGIGLVIATAIRDTELVGLVTNVVYLPMMFLSGTFFPLTSLPEALRWVAYLLPLTYLTEGLRATMVLGDQNVGATSLLVLVAVALVSLVVGSLLADWSQD